MSGKADVKPLAGTDLCEAPHFQYHVAGTLHVVVDWYGASTYARG